MGRALKSLVYVAACLTLGSAYGQVPTPPANCTRSATLLACHDQLGNAYSVATAGATIYLRGYEAEGKRFWAQTNSRYGQLTFFTGVATNGETWVGYSRKVGWTTINRFSSSGGTASTTFTCNRLGGC